MVVGEMRAAGVVHRALFVNNEGQAFSPALALASPPSWRNASSADAEFEWYDCGFI
jgi:hypothetical protein